VAALEDTLKTEVAQLFAEKWPDPVPVATTVPEPEDLLLGSNDAKQIDATILYADLAASTALVDSHQWWFAGEVYKAFLHCAGKIIKAKGGVIVSYDGDRIMAVFIGGSKNTSAVNAALCINGAVSQVINPAIRSQYGTSTTYQMTHAVGVDTGTIYAARTGVRGNNDIVWIGKPANHAAKLCNLRSGYYATWVTSEVYQNMNDNQIYSETHPGVCMWQQDYWNEYQRTVYKSTWYRYGY
jgi:class 3 adenylate cyclase